jgi:hypothetical protein
MMRRRIDFMPNTSAPRELEEKFGTMNDITLHPDLEFARGWLYGGPFGPRLVFNPEVMFRDDVFILPVDQQGYFTKMRDELDSRFTDIEKDKCKTREEKLKLLDEYSRSDRAIVPEIHVPTRLELGQLKAVLLYHQDADKYRKKLTSIGVETIPFGEDENPVFEKVYGKVVSKAYWEWVTNKV